MNNNLKSFCVKVFERGLAISAYIFPIIEISYSFGPKVFSGTNNIFLNYCYFNYIAKLNVIYTNNVYLIFVLMVGIFMVCSRGTLPLSKFLRYNVIQAILLNILCSCVGFQLCVLPSRCSRKSYRKFNFKLYVPRNNGINRLCRNFNHFWRLSTYSCAF